MRWPNRHPHRLTDGMRRAQKALADFVGFIDWARFRRTNLNEEVAVSSPDLHVFACGDRTQALVWLLRRDVLTATGMIDGSAARIASRVGVPGLAPGRHEITPWDTAAGAAGARITAEATGAGLVFQTPPFAADLAFAIRSAGQSSI